MPTPDFIPSGKARPGRPFADCPLFTGHRRAASGMLGVYNRMAVRDDRLRRVTDHIHDWLFTESAAAPAALPESDASAAPQAAPVAQAD